jgi:hypothetical protein
MVLLLFGLTTKTHVVDATATDIHTMRAEITRVITPTLGILLLILLPAVIAQDSTTLT